MVYSNYDSIAAISSGVTIAVWVISILLSLAIIAALWILFDKAGYPGWAAIVPYYNMYIMSQIATGGSLMFWLLFVPVINVFVQLYLYFKFARAFGAGVMGGILTVLFSPIMLCIYAFGPAEYEGY